MDIKYETIFKSELEDFARSCQQYSLDPHDFKFIEHDVIRNDIGNGLHHPNGKLTISKNGKSKTYITGHGSKWPYEFECDLNAGLFK